MAYVSIQRRWWVTPRANSTSFLISLTKMTVLKCIVWRGLIFLELIFLFIVFLFSDLALYSLWSGEKTSTKDWPGFLEIKGRVRLDAFQKFLLELPQSRTRAIMVSQISFSFTRSAYHLFISPAIYKRMIKKEKNCCSFMLFLSFFLSHV